MFNQVNQTLVGNISNMEMIDDNTFDVTVCYGAPLSYMYDNYTEGMRELYRVTKPGGKVFVSVNSRFGVIRALLGRDGFDIVDFLSKREYWHIDKVVDEGNRPVHPEVPQPARHFFEAIELRTVFESVGFSNVEMGSSPCLTTGLFNRTEEIHENDVAWETLIDLELKSYKKESTLDLGEFLMIKGTKKI